MSWLLINLSFRPTCIRSRNFVYDYLGFTRLEDVCHFDVGGIFPLHFCKYSDNCCKSQKQQVDVLYADTVFDPAHKLWNWYISGGCKDAPVEKAEFLITWSVNCKSHGILNLF